MRSLLKIGAVIVAQSLVACGQAAQNHISDDPQSQADLGSTGQAIHNANGWSKVVNIFLAANAPKVIAKATENAATAWNNAAGFEIIHFGGYAESYTEQGSNLYSTLDDESTILYFDESNWKVHTGKAETTLATTVWESEVEIVRGDIILDAENYQFIDGLDEDNSDLADDSLVDAESVIVHEMGHLLGLNHVAMSKDRNSVMLAKTMIGYGVTKRKPSAGDKALIQSIYTTPRSQE